MLLATDSRFSSWGLGSSVLSQNLSTETGAIYRLFTRRPCYRHSEQNHRMSSQIVQGMWTPASRPAPGSLFFTGVMALAVVLCQTTKAFLAQTVQPPVRTPFMIYPCGDKHRTIQFLNSSMPSADRLILLRVLLALFAFLLCC